MSNKQKVTPWFAAEVAPARPGVYQVRKTAFGIEEVMYSYWNGFMWCAMSAIARNAFANRGRPTWFSVSSWRGLASRP